MTRFTIHDVAARETPDDRFLLESEVNARISELQATSTAQVEEIRSLKQHNQALKRAIIDVCGLYATLCPDTHD